ncbi:MAG: flagellar hook-length control protein FliK [SAR324 cluster bacterium]|nr:flagellar hook-length control protein FliK [SAR324 cluster bacterium]
MEAIGQKAVIPVTDEAVAATEFGIESGEKGENQVFDATLDQMLTELPLDEKLLEELLDEDGLSASLNSVLLTQSQLDPEIADTDFGIVNNSNMPLEILGDDLWSEDVSSLQTQVLKKSTPISAEIIEVVDPRIVVNGSNVDVLPESGIAETGLQSLLQESTTEFTDPLLGTVFHQVKSPGNSEGISVEEQQKLSHSIPLEADAEFSASDQQTVLQKSASQSVLAEGELGIKKSELPPELQPNSNQTLQGKNALVQDLSSILENQEESLQENLQTVFRQGTQEESLDADYLQKLKRGDVPLTPEKIKASESLQVVEKFKTNEALQPNSNQTLQGKNALVQDLSSILENQEESLQENLQTVSRQGTQDESLDADYLQKLKRGDVPLTPEKIKASESHQVVEKFKTNEALQTAEKFQGGTGEKAVEGLQTSEKFQLAEKFQGGTGEKASESHQVVEKFKTNEALQTAEKFQLAKKFQGGVREKAVEGLQVSEKFQLGEKFQGGTGEKAVEGLQSSEKFQLAEEFKSNSKTKLEVGFQATEKFKLAEELQSRAKTRTVENFQLTGVETTTGVSEKGSEQPLNQFRTLTAKDTQLPASSKSSADTVSSAGINSLAEVSGTTMVKGATTNTPAEPLRGADLPFNMEQVVSRVRILNGNGVEEMTLRLHPEDLGQITVKIRQSGADLLIDMRVDNPQAKLLVESGFDSLRSRFLDQEFSYQDLALNVDINERDSQFGGDRKNYEFEDDLNSAERGKKEEIADVEETPRVINRNDSGLNLYV